MSAAAPTGLTKKLRVSRVVRGVVTPPGEDPCAVHLHECIEAGLRQGRTLAYVQETDYGYAVYWLVDGDDPPRCPTPAPLAPPKNPCVRVQRDGSGNVIAIETYQGGRGWCLVTASTAGPVIQRGDS